MLTGWCTVASYHRNREAQYNARDWGRASSATSPRTRASSAARIGTATTGRASAPGPNRRSPRAAMCGSSALGGVVDGYDEVDETRFFPDVMPIAQIGIKTQTQIS